MRVDVRDWEDVRAAAEEVSFRSGAVDVAVNVPGINRRKPVLELEPEEFSEVLDVNIRGLFHCAKAYGGLMVPNGRGSIVNMASIFGLVAMERQAAYASSKGAVVQLTKVLALEFARHSVRVNALAPRLLHHAAGAPDHGRRGLVRGRRRPRAAGPVRGGLGDRRPHGLSRIKSLELRHRGGAHGGRPVDGGLREVSGSGFR